MRGLIGIYVVIAILAGTWFYFVGDTSHRGYAYNLGQGLVWPIAIFSNSPEIDGDSPADFAESYVEVVQSARKNGMYPTINEATNLLQFYIYADNNEQVTRAQYDAILEDGAGAVPVMLAATRAINDSPDMLEEYLDYLDGMSASDLVGDREDLMEEIEDLMEDRPLANSR